MRILTYTVTEADAGRAVRSVVPRRFCLGQHAFRRLKVLGAIRIGDAPVRANYRLHAGEVVEVHLPSDMAQESGAREAAVPGLPPSFLRYQDEDLLIVSKGAPLPTLPARHITSGTLREQVMQMLRADPETFVYHPVNRLDKGTSGLLCIARHAHAQRLLTGQLHTGGFIREYLAVTEGVPAAPAGTIDAPIARHPVDRKRMAVVQGGKPSQTEWRVIESLRGATYLDVHLLTGRTHQIRVHMQSIGHPLLGDAIYAPNLRMPVRIPRLMLHAYSLQFTHPTTGERMELTAPLPEAFETTLQKLS